MRKFLWSLFEVFETVAVAVIVVFVIRTFLIQPFLVSGASMEPNFSEGNYLLVDELTYRLRAPERGEVVVFKSPVGKDYFIKRVVGLPGEEIEIKGDRVYVAGKPLPEDYLYGAKTPIDLKVKLKQNQYFVLGDNRGYSFDSRSWGPLDRDSLVGIVRLRLWPLNKVMAYN